jgi:PilZ domain
MEKRRDPRLAIGQPVAVTILSGEPFTCNANVNNWSGNGMALEMPTPAPPGAALQMLLEDPPLRGEVVHCGAQEGGYLVGVLLDSELSQLSRLAQTLERFADSAGPHQGPTGPRKHGPQGVLEAVPAAVASSP